MRSLATAYVEFPLARVFITDAPNVTCDAMPANRATTLAPRELAHEPDAPPFGSRELARALEGVGARMPRSVVGTPSGMADGCTAVLWSRFEYSENAWDAENKVACNAQRAARNVQHATIRRDSDRRIQAGVRRAVASSASAAGQPAVGSCCVCRGRLAITCAGSRSRARPSAAATSTPTSRTRATCICSPCGRFALLPVCVSVRACVRARASACLRACKCAAGARGRACVRARSRSCVCAGKQARAPAA